MNSISSDNVGCKTALEVARPATYQSLPKLAQQ